MDTQVLVVGAGPVGLTMAAELARYGVRVRIVDTNRARTDKSKALVLWSRTLELLEQAGCVAPFIEAGQKMVGANIFSGGKRVGYVDLTTIHSAYNYALMLPQSETERLLEAHLETLGIHVERETEATSLSDLGSAVTVALRGADGRTENLCVDWVAGCDGAHSFVRHTLGLSFEGETLLSDWILADVHLKGLPTPDNELATYWHQDGVIAIFPITPGRYRVIADVGLSKGAMPADPTLQEVQAIVDQRGPGGVSLSEPIWLSSFRINERKVARYGKGRVFLAGDASHVHSPAGGQGMNTGMQDAFNLAWKLGLVCRGRAQAQVLLDSYSDERSAVGEKVLSDAGRLTMVATMRNPLAIAARNVVGSLLFGLTPVKDAMAQNFSETTIGYPDSPLNGASARHPHGPKPGQRMPPQAGAPMSVSGDTPRFTLWATPGASTTALLDDHVELLAPGLLPPPDATSMWLVRPDGYVACVTHDAQDIDRYLDALK